MKTTNNAPSINDFKHKYEKRLLILGYSLTIIISILCLFVIFSGYVLKDWTYLLLAGLLSPILGIFVIRFIYYKKIKNGVEITENQLPELYELYKEIALKMGFTEEKGKLQIPPLYVVSGFGIKDFLSSKSESYEKYIVLKSDVANIIYKENGNIGGLCFIIAQHLAHFKCNHFNLKKVVIFPIMSMLFLQKLLSKAEEYTADRVACYYFPENIEDIINLHIKMHLGEQINTDEYFKDLEKYENNLYLKLENLTKSSVAYRRIKTLREAQTKGWNVHGKIF